MGGRNERERLLDHNCFSLLFNMLIHRISLLIITLTTTYNIYLSLGYSLSECEYDIFPSNSDTQQHSTEYSIDDVQKIIDYQISCNNESETSTNSSCCHVLNFNIHPGTHYLSAPISAYLSNDQTFPSINFIGVRSSNHSSPIISGGTPVPNTAWIPCSHPNPRCLGWTGPQLFAIPLTGIPNLTHSTYPRVLWYGPHRVQRAATTGRALQALRLAPLGGNATGFAVHGLPLPVGVCRLGVCRCGTALGIRDP